MRGGLSLERHSATAAACPLPDPTSLSFMAACPPAKSRRAGREGARREGGREGGRKGDGEGRVVEAFRFHLQIHPIFHPPFSPEFHLLEREEEEFITHQMGRARHVAGVCKTWCRCV